MAVFNLDVRCHRINTSLVSLDVEVVSWHVVDRKRTKSRPRAFKRDRRCLEDVYRVAGQDVSCQDLSQRTTN